MPARWSKDDELLVKTFWGKIPLAEIGKKLSMIRSKSLICEKGVRMGLPPYSGNKSRIKKKVARRWSHADEMILLEYWSKKPLNFIRGKLSVSRTIKMILHKADKMKLAKDEQFKENNKRRTPFIADQEFIVNNQQVLQQIERKNAILKHQEKCGW